MVLVTFSGPSFKVEQVLPTEEVKGFIDMLKSSGIAGDLSIIKV
jgi:hypothetical protein